MRGEAGGDEEAIGVVEDGVEGADNQRRAADFQRLYADFQLLLEEWYGTVHGTEGTEATEETEEERIENASGRGDGVRCWIKSEMRDIHVLRSSTGTS